MSLSAAAVSGQYFIYSLVKEYGALVFAITMNLRQVISILVSYIMYGHVITFLQLVGLVFVFAALFYKSATGSDKKKKPQALPQSDAAADTAPKPETVGQGDVELANTSGNPADR